MIVQSLKYANVSVGMTQNNSTHRKIIAAIHEHWFNGSAFALRDVASESNVSTSSVVRTLKMLKGMKMVSYSIKAYQGRHYRVNTSWPHNEKEVIEAFELAKILRI